MIAKCSCCGRPSMIHIDTDKEPTQMVCGRCQTQWTKVVAVLCWLFALVAISWVAYAMLRMTANL